MANVTKDNNLGLGQRVAKGDYESLLEKLKSYENTEDLVILKELVKGQVCSELDSLFYHMMRFAVVKPKKQEESEDNEVLGNNLTALLNENTNCNCIKETVKIEKAELQPYFLEVVDILLKYGANPNVPVVNGITPFMMSCTINNPEVARKLLENPNKFEDLRTGDMISYKADLNMGDGKGNRPLYYATMSQSIETMEFLVNECSVDVNFQSFLSNNKTIFHQICESFNCDIIIEKDGFKIELASDQDKTVAIEKLMELGANPSLKDDYDNVPEMLIPVFDPEIHEEGEVSEEELALWDQIYEKIGAYRKDYEQKNVKKHKTSF